MIEVESSVFPEFKIKGANKDGELLISRKKNPYFLVSIDGGDVSITISKKLQQKLSTTINIKDILDNYPIYRIPETYTTNENNNQITNYQKDENGEQLYYYVVDIKGEH